MHSSALHCVSGKPIRYMDSLRMELKILIRGPGDFNLNFFSDLVKPIVVFPILFSMDKSHKRVHVLLVTTLALLPPLLLLLCELFGILSKPYPGLLDPVLDEDFAMHLEMHYSNSKFLPTDKFAETVKGNWKSFSYAKLKDRSLIFSSLSIRKCQTGFWRRPGANDLTRSLLQSGLSMKASTERSTSRKSSMETFFRRKST